jgi:hypothetical protein
MQQIRDRLFPRGDIFVADRLLLSRFVAVIAGFRIEICFSRLASSLEDLLGFFLIVEAAGRLLGSPTARVFLVLSVTATGARLRRGTVGGEFACRLDPCGFDLRLALVGFGTGRVVPVG